MGFWGGRHDDHERLSDSQFVRKHSEEDKRPGKDCRVPHVDAVGVRGRAAEDDNPVEGEDADRSEVEEQEK